MKNLKFLATGDWHISSNPYAINKIKASLDQMLEYVKEIKVDALIHGGDIWDKPQKEPYFDSKEGDGVELAKTYLREFSKYVKHIFIVKGNNSHDPVGSVRKLHHLEPNINAYEVPVSLAIVNNVDIDVLRIDCPHQPQYIVSLVPYPTKGTFITETSIDNNNFDFLEKFEQMFELIGDKTSEYNCPKILAFHGNISGSRLSTGQTLQSQDILVSPGTLLKAKQIYYHLSHIHLYQEILPNMFYSGSIASLNWGEIEQKSFQVITFEDNEMNIERVMLTSARPMITIEAEYQDGIFMTEAGDLDDYVVNDEEFRIRIRVNENERNLITDDKIQTLKNNFGEDVKIEFNIIPVERESRSEQIMNCRTLLDEVKEYATVINEPINGTIETKVLQLQEGGAK